MAYFITASLCQSAFAETPDSTISLGMKRVDVLQLLKNNGSTEVFKDVSPDAKGWWVESHHECLFLSYKDDVLTGISVEEKADQPKMYRRWHDAKTYNLR